MDRSPDQLMVVKDPPLPSHQEESNFWRVMPKQMA